MTSLFLIILWYLNDFAKIRVFTTGHCIFENLQIGRMVIETVFLLEGKIDDKRIEEIAQAEMAGLRCDTREPGWILYHGQRTGELAMLLAGKLNFQVDCDILYIAGLFHDIGKGNDMHNEV